jgi:hypothetical protein
MDGSDDVPEITFSAWGAPLDFDGNLPVRLPFYCLAVAELGPGVWHNIFESVRLDWAMMPIMTERQHHAISSKQEFIA